MPGFLVMLFAEEANSKMKKSHECLLTAAIVKASAIVCNACLYIPAVTFSTPSSCAQKKNRKIRF